MKYFIAVLMCSLLFSCASRVEKRYILVRHAEKQMDVKKDPELTEVGKQRAERLSIMLAKSGITKIYSSNYKRALMTARPLAKKLNLEIMIYNPRELDLFAKNLTQESGTIFIVGHSNTTPQLTRLLSKQKVDDMSESEYGDVYIVSSINGETSLIKILSE